jgi:hypothetical protein
MQAHRHTQIRWPASLCPTCKQHQSAALSYLRTSLRPKLVPGVALDASKCQSPFPPGMMYFANFK